MTILRSGKVSQSLNKPKTQISKRQNKVKAPVQKVVKLSAVQEPPSSPPHITSHITGKQLPNAEGSTAHLPIRVISSINSMDYDSGEEDALGLQFELSPILPSIDSLHKMHASLDSNREDDQELPAEAEDDEEDEGEVEELPPLRSRKAKVVFEGGFLLRSSGRATRKTLKAASQLKPHRASQIGNQYMHKSTSAKPSNAPKSTTRKSRRPEPPISDIEASDDSIRELKKTPTKASKCYRKELLNSSLAPAVATFIINIVVLFNYKKLFILSSVKKLDNILFSLIIINEKEGAKKYAIS